MPAAFVTGPEVIKTVTGAQIRDLLVTRVSPLISPAAKAPQGGAETGPATQALYDRGYTLFHCWPPPPLTAFYRAGSWGDA